MDFSPLLQTLVGAVSALAGGVYVHLVVRNIDYRESLNVLRVNLNSLATYAAAGVTAIEIYAERESSVSEDVVRKLTEEIRRHYQEIDSERSWKVVNNVVAERSRIALLSARHILFPAGQGHEGLASALQKLGRESISAVDAIDVELTNFSIFSISQLAANR